MRAIRLLAATGLVAVLGCGPDTPDFPDTAPVKATFKFKGAPLDGATVGFVPAGGAAAAGGGEKAYPAGGMTEADGTCAVTTYFSPAVTKEGAVPGKYKVTVKKMPPALSTGGEHDADTSTSAQKGPTNLLPKQYASEDTTPLEATVEAGKENTFEFEVK